MMSDWNRSGRHADDARRARAQEDRELGRPEDWRAGYPAEEARSFEKRRFGGGFGLAGLEDGWVDPDTGGFTGESFGGPDFTPQHRRGDEGPHRGRGPRNYVRSDARVREDVSDRLSDDPWLDASEIEVQVAGCEVTLNGTVQSREDRRRAEDLAEQARGVTHVQNNLRVRPTGRQTGIPSVTGGSAPPIA